MSIKVGLKNSAYFKLNDLYNQLFEFNKRFKDAEFNEFVGELIDFHNNYLVIIVGEANEDS